MPVEIGIAHSAWRTVLGRLPDDLADIYLTPEYHDLHAQGEEASCAALITRGSASLLVAGLRHSLADSPVAGRAAGLWDVQSCNGYGGPIGVGCDVAFIEWAWRAWAREASRQGAVAAFFRLHPVLQTRQWLPAHAEIRADRPTYYVDLTAGRERAWDAAEGRHRNLVRKARRAGCEVVWNAARDWPAFGELYCCAMERLAAPERLRFTPGYFASLSTLPAAELACVRAGDALQAGAIFLFGRRLAHYHLAARAPDAPSYLGNLILDAALDRAGARGLAGMHLGGGRTSQPDDALLRFKRSLGGRPLCFDVARVVVDEARFSALLQAWRALSGREPSWLLGYREPLAR